MLTVEQITEHYTEQGIEEMLAIKLAECAMDNVLTFKDKNPGKVIDAKSIIVFAHSFRQNEIGNKTSGPINQQLADIVEHYYLILKIPVYAQWEVGILLIDKIPENHLHITYPNVDDSKGFQHFSTIDVLNKTIKDHDMNPINHEPVLVMAHKWHVVRCVRYLQEDPQAKCHFNTITVQEDTPSDWDEKAGLIWASDPESHMISHMISALADHLNQHLLPKLRQKRNTK